MYIIDILKENVIDKVNSGYYNEKDDQSTLKINDNRKTRLTLHNLRRLRLMNIAREVEYEQKKDSLFIQYGEPEDSSGGGSMF